MTFHRFRTAAACSLALAGPAAAQDIKTRAYLSPLPALEQTGKPPEEAVTIKQNLLLRPNVEQHAYVFLHNDGTVPESVHVVLAAGTKAGDEIARTAAPVAVGPGETKRVALAPAKPAPPPAPPAFGPDGKPLPPPPASPGARLDGDGTLLVRVYDADAKGKAEKPAELKRYALVGVQNLSVVPSAANGTLTVTISHRADANNKFTEKPFKVRLDLRPDLNPDLDPETLAQGVFEADLPVGGEVTLAAEGVKFKPGAKDTLATVGVSADGYDRVFLWKTNFSDATGKQVDSFANVRFAAPATYLAKGRAAVLTGKAVGVAVETYRNNAEVDDKKYTLSVGRADGKFDALLTDKPARDKAVFVKPGGEDDALVFTTVLKDWELVYPTVNVAGARAFKVAAGTDAATTALVVDRTAPVVKFTAAPKAADLEVGKKSLLLSATAADPESGLAKVYFYVGDLPTADFKPAPGGKLIRGVPKLDKDGKPTGEYTAEMTLPNKAGELRVGVFASNNVGLTASAPDDGYELVLREKAAPKAKPTTGSIEGKVVQGDRPQPKIAVTLLDATGKSVVKSATTDADGKFKFEDVAPGGYRVRAVKTADAALASGTKDVSVVASETPSKVEVTVLR